MRTHIRCFLLRSLITCILTAVLITGTSLIYVSANDTKAFSARAYDAMTFYAGEKDMTGLDEYIATDLVGRTGKAAAEAADDAKHAEPVLDAGAYTFAEALAQEYRHIDGKFLLSESSRFYIVSEEKPGRDILDTVRTMASQYAACGIPSEEPLPIVYGKAELAEKGDIVINLVREEEFLPGIETADIGQTYRIDIYDTAAVEACSTDGIWYGLIELMQIAREKRAVVPENDEAEQNGETPEGSAQGIVLDCFRIKDGPDLKERALMLDCGRKYFSKEWIENLIRRASLQRYNALVLHFAEAEGIRFDSEVFPWLTDNIDSLSTEDMEEIVRLAQQYHMEVIPSFDTPGHNTFMVDRYAQYVRKHPDFSFTLDGKTYDSSIKGFGSIANHYSHGGETESADYIGIDLTREHAVAFTEALIDGYADYFRELGCDKMDIGSDELLGWYTFELGGTLFDYDNRWKALDHWTRFARKKLGIDKGSSSDVLITYINDLAERLEKKGYTCRVFNDEIDLNPDQHVELKESIEITYWFDEDNTAGHYAKKGHVMHNFMESWCFYVLRKNKGRDIMTNKYKTVNARNIFENWDPRSFARKAGKKMTVPDDKLGGGYFAIWCDSPGYKDAATVWEETELRTWANASRMWNAEVNSDRSGINDKASYKDMKKFAKKFGEFPGYTGDPETPVSMPGTGSLTEAGTKWQKLISSVMGDDSGV